MSFRKNIKFNTKKVRRGRRKSAKNISKSLRFLGVNSAGLKSKLNTFRKVLKELQPSVFFVQESKYKEEGKLKIDNFEIFESVRKSRDGGGLVLGCLRELEPVLVSKGDEEVEAMSVEISVKQMRIRCCVAYGCQENSLLDKKVKFWNFIEEEVTTSWNQGSGFILQFDGNLWAGPQIIPGDPRKQNTNGKLFQEFLARNPNLTVVNSLPQCKGLITRIRDKEGKMEKSVLDFFVVCSRILPYVTSMVIDEEKKYILTNYKTAKKGSKATDSDHFTEYLDVNLKIISEKPVRKEIFNFKNGASLEKFNEITSNTSQFTECFKSNLPLSEQVSNWRTVLKSHCQTAFQKIRINKKRRTKGVNKEMSILIDQRNELLRRNCSKDQEMIKNIEKTIANMEAFENREFIKKHFGKFSEDPEAINLQEMWKVLKKINPKHGKAIPIAKKNHIGKLISSPKEIKKLLGKEYKQRLRPRPTRPDLGNIKRRRQLIFDMQLRIASSNKSLPWTMSDLDTVLRGLKNNKSRDHAGYVNEIFKPGVIGSDLKESLLTMFNGLKTKKLIPEFMRMPNITTVPKKGSLTLLENERGIFCVDKLRSILMRMVYNDKYPIIDKNMSDSQMGGRKGKGCRDNIFIINGIIHDVLRSIKNKPVLLQIYDYSQMFDSINLKQAISDIYEAGLKDDNLHLIFEANKEILMSVNTPAGLTDRQTLENIVLQGDTWGSLLASVLVDSIGQECSTFGYGYQYKNKLSIGMLGLVDDIIGVTEAGFKAQMLNAFLNVKTAEKNLQFGIKKCKSMLVGKNTKNVLNSSLCVDKWTVEHVEDKTTGDTELVEHYAGQVEIEKCTEQKYLGFIISASGDNMANIRSLRNKSIGTIKKMFSKLNSMSLQKYYFECGVIFLNTMLRTSILYASETYYNLKEGEMRQIERIEENYMRQLLKTSKGCPLSQLYLELGQRPARFDIFKLQLFYLKHILNQDESSTLYQFVKLQLENPTKGDWVSSVMDTLQKLDISLTLEEIKEISNGKYKKLVKQKCEESAFSYLLKKRGSKGSEIKYQTLEMARYLLPNDEFEIDDQRYVFQLRNNMVDIPSSYTAKEDNNFKCHCNQTEDIEHIYNCKYLNNTEPDTHFGNIFTETLIEQKKVFIRFSENMKKREKYTDMKKTEKVKNEATHVIHSDPLYSTSCIVMDI